MVLPEGFTWMDSSVPKQLIYVMLGFFMMADLGGSTSGGWFRASLSIVKKYFTNQNVVVVKKN